MGELRSFESRKYEILSLLTDYTRISKEVLTLVLGGSSHSRRILKRMEDEGFVKNTKVDITDKNKKHKYYTAFIKICYKGKTELNELGIEDFVHERSSNALERYKKVADSVITCCVAGCIGYKKLGYPEYYNLDKTEEYNDINPFAAERTESINGYEVGESSFNYEKAITVINGSGIVISAKDIRNYFELTTDDVNHFRFPSATGVLLSKSGPYFLYHANEGYLSVTKAGEENFTEQVMLHLYRCGICKMELSSGGFLSSNKNGIVFINNIVDFRRFIKNQYKIRDISYQSFQVFRTISIIPTSVHGVELLKLLKTFGSGEIKQSVIKILLKNGYQLRSEVSDSYLYPIIDKKGKKVYYGIDMDLNAILELQKDVQANEGNQEFRIVCFAWQKEFYKTILGNEVLFVSINPVVLTNELENGNKTDK